MPPQPSPATSLKPTTFTTQHNLSSDDKENLTKASNMKPTIRARRGSFAVKPVSTTLTGQTIKPRRRASIATTFQSEPSSSSSMMTPGMRQNNAPRMRNDRVGRQSFVWDPQRMWRTSRVQSSPVEATPVAAAPRRFMGSPSSHAVGSWKPKHPTVVALQRKQLVWSPLKYKGTTKGVRK